MTAAVAEAATAEPMVDRIVEGERVEVETLEVNRDSVSAHSDVATQNELVGNGAKLVLFRLSAMWQMKPLRTVRLKQNPWLRRLNRDDRTGSIFGEVAVEAAKSTAETAAAKAEDIVDSVTDKAEAVTHAASDKAEAVQMRIR